MITGISETDLYELIILMRMGERALLSFTIIIVTVIIMIVFWKRFQRIQFEINHNESALKADIIFVLPVFLLLSLILFAFVSFSSPIQSSISTGESTENTQPRHEGQRSSNFNGVVGGNPTTQAIYLDALSDAIELMLNEQPSKNQPTAAALTNLQRALVMDIYGQSVIDTCRDVNSNEFNENTCRKIRKWLRISI